MTTAGDAESGGQCLHLLAHGIDGMALSPASRFQAGTNSISKSEDFYYIIRFNTLYVLHNVSSVT